jgi:hypothetical protein
MDRTVMTKVAAVAVSLAAVTAGCASSGNARPGEFPDRSADRIIDAGSARLVGPDASLHLDHGVLAGTLEGGSYRVAVTSDSARGSGPLGPIDLQIKSVAGGHDLSGVWNGGPVHFLIGDQGARGELLRQISAGNPGQESCDYDIKKLHNKATYSGIARCLGEEHPLRFDLQARAPAALTGEENAILLLAYFAAPPPLGTI